MASHRVRFQLASRDIAESLDNATPVAYDGGMTTEQLTIEQAIAAGQQAIDQVELHADESWKDFALLCIVNRRPGMTFMAEHIAALVNGRGYTTHDNRAMGAVIRKAARLGLIERCGAAPARTSHGSLKPIWRRV